MTASLSSQDHPIRGEADGRNPTSSAYYGWGFDFRQTGDFEAVRAAERFLAEAGFSLGIMQKGSPRGILFGDFDIQKWRNLREADREALHGTMTGDRRGPVHVWIKRAAPPEAHEALYVANAKLHAVSPQTPDTAEQKDA